MSTTALRRIVLRCNAVLVQERVGGSHGETRGTAAFGVPRQPAASGGAARRVRAARGSPRTTRR